MNKVMLLGRLGKSPETKYTTNGGAITTFSLATSEKIKGEYQTEWHNCVAFGKLAEIIQQYTQKGSQLYVEGKIKTNKYKDAGGATKYSTSIIVNNIEFIGGSKKSEQDNGQESAGFVDTDGEKIPF